MATSSPLTVPAGSLAEVPLLELLMVALERRLSGTIELHLDDAPKAAIVTIGGRSAKVWTADLVHPLGAVLAETGAISIDQLRESIDRLKGGGMLQGEVLLELGAVSSETLEKGLRLQVARKLEHVLSLPSEATFAYHDGVDLLEDIGGDPTPIDPFPAMWRGACSAPPMAHVEAVTERISGARLRRSAVAQLERFDIDPSTLRTLEELGERSATFAEVVEKLGPDCGHAIVYLLILSRQLDVIEEPTIFDSEVDIAAMISETISSVPPSMPSMPTALETHPPPSSTSPASVPSSGFPSAPPAPASTASTASVVDPDTSNQSAIHAILEAAEAFERAEIILRQRPSDPQAYELVRHCVSLDPRSDYVATLAWLDAQRPEWLSVTKTLEKVAVLDRCIQKHPESERALLYRALLYKRADMPKKALKDFKRLIELNPRHVDAQRELKLHRMRADAAFIEEGAHRSGLLHRLFNRN